MSKQLRTTGQGPRIIVLDIETAPIEARVWSTFKVNVGLNQITRDWSVLSYSYKELGGRTHYEDTFKPLVTQGLEVTEDALRDDFQLLVNLHGVLNSADIVVAQNGVAFDLKKIQARFIQLGFDPCAPFKVVDTLLMAKQVAKFTSNKLDWMSQILTAIPKGHHKEFPGMDLWTECLKGNPRAWKEMKAYNKRDVDATEDVYRKLLPYYAGHPNVAAYYSDDSMRCPRCGSVHVTDQGRSTYTQTGEYRQYRCADCGGFSRSRYTLNSKAKRQSLLTS